MYLEDVIKELLSIKEQHGNIVVEVRNKEGYYSWGDKIDKISVREHKSSSILDETYIYVGIESR